MQKVTYADKFSLRPLTALLRKLTIDSRLLSGSQLTINRSTLCNCNFSGLLYFLFYL